jgi:asparagine synthetase B (glutamine-hydrolysing)
LLSVAELCALSLDAGRRHRKTSSRGSGWSGGTARFPPIPTGACRFGVVRDWTLESAREELDALLRQSIREHMISDVPLGMWLSGGIDSSTILHYAAMNPVRRSRPSRFHSRDGASTRPRTFARLQQRYQTEHEELDLNPEVDLRDAIEEFAYYSDEPSADAGALPVWFLSKLSKTKTTVSLSGEGADELFGGYLTHRANRWLLSPGDCRGRLSSSRSARCRFGRFRTRKSASNTS